MAKANKPPRRNSKGKPPAPEEASNNMSAKPTRVSGAPKKDLNFKVDADFKLEYKTYASSKDKSMVDILTESFELYKQQNP